MGRVDVRHCHSPITTPLFLYCIVLWRGWTQLPRIDCIRIPSLPVSVFCTWQRNKQNCHVLAVEWRWDKYSKWNPNTQRVSERSPWFRSVADKEMIDRLQWVSQKTVYLSCIIYIRSVYGMSTTVQYVVCVGLSPRKIYSVMYSTSFLFLIHFLLLLSFSFGKKKRNCSKTWLSKFSSVRIVPTTHTHTHTYIYI